MRQKSMSKNDPAERTVRDIRRKTRKQYTAEEKELYPKVGDAMN